MSLEGRPGLEDAQVKAIWVELVERGLGNFDMYLIGRVSDEHASADVRLHKITDPEGGYFVYVNDARMGLRDEKVAEAAQLLIRLCRGLQERGVPLRRIAFQRSSDYSKLEELVEKELSF